ncbi:hypothetical protein L484_024602 [Morus notabilis]|uniref:Uncharacterized protein n=1 Tax=Morus notabilis TaxID=981085 RepID=W9QZE2_9ROSA|nr:hypothetical protein L484_024602 [Morus notabilis]
MSSASSSSKRPPITKGDGKRINNTNTTADNIKESSGNSITHQKDGKKDDEGTVTNATSEKKNESTDQK